MTVPTRIRREVTADDRESVLSAGVCGYCGDQRGPFEVDHVRPLSRGGTNRRGNLACACVSCNTQKGTFLLHEWIQWRKANGMFWPPVASHPTDPQHFPDYCEFCRKRVEDATPEGVIPERSLYIYGAVDLQWGGDGYTCYYRCTEGHAWKCYYAAWGYYSDCSCNYCIACRLEESVPPG